MFFSSSHSQARAATAPILDAVIFAHRELGLGCLRSVLGEPVWRIESLQGRLRLTQS